MLLTLSTTHQPATDLGYLLAKHPGRTQSFGLTFGQAHVFYPEATEERCTAALLLDIEPVGLVRTKPDSYPLEHYVNDRPYVASSFMSVALSTVFRTAMAGRCGGKPELASTPIPLEIELTSVPSRGGESLIRELFEPLGYEVATTRHPLDPLYPDWGLSPYYHLRLGHHLLLSEALSHIYVLLPVLDDDKHYYVGPDEVEKLFRHGRSWLKSHPRRELIARRYLKHVRSLERELLVRLGVEDSPGDETERAPRLHDDRLATVVAVLKSLGACSVLDLGCGEGKLIRLLLKERTIQRILGVDVASLALERAAERLRLDRMPPRQARKLTLKLGSLVYRDRALEGFDAAAVVEVIEHLDPHRLASFERCLFEFARPSAVIVTTPNREYNELWTSLPAGKVRHRDHRFEWTRPEFAGWAQRVAETYGYAVCFLPVGPADPERGAPTQMAVFNR